MRRPGFHQRGRRDRARLAAGLGAGVLLHLLLLVVAMLLHGERPPPSPRSAAAPPAAAFAMRPLSDSQWQRNRGPVPPVPPPKPPEPPAQREPTGQVVDVAPGNNQDAPNAAHLAETSNKVQRETRAREQTPLYRNAMPRQTSPDARNGSGQQGSPNAGLGGEGSDRTPPARRKGAFEVPDAERQERVAMRAPEHKGAGPRLSNRSESDEVRGNAERLRVEPGNPDGAQREESSGRAGQRGPLQLMPSQAVLDQIAGAAPNDHLQNVDEGDATLLNTKEWKYASFFNRVKQSVGMHWNPGGPLRQRDPTGDTYSGKDRYTLLAITLDDRGRVNQIQVEKSSGLEFLDAEAIAAFHRAQPFPNPPPGLLGAEGQVKFSFGFFIELGSGARLRLFR